MLQCCLSCPSPTPPSPLSCPYCGFARASGCPECPIPSVRLSAYLWQPEWEPESVSAAFCMPWHSCKSACRSLTYFPQAALIMALAQPWAAQTASLTAQTASLTASAELLAPLWEPMLDLAALNGMCAIAGSGISYSD